MIGRAVTRASVWAAGVFYRVERIGAELPAGPLLILGNHPNMLMDPLLVLGAARRRARALAKAPLFAMPIFGPVLRSMDTLPVYRVQDDPEQLHRNREVFDEAVAALRRGAALMLFPEGRCHSGPALAPLKTGTARMALSAEEESGWRLGVKVVPIGLTYQRRQRFRSRVVVGVGVPVVVSEWREPYEADRPAAVRSLTGAITLGLERHTLNLAAESDRELVETAEVLQTRVRGLAGWRDREALQARLPRLQRFAEQFAWLRAADPQRFERTARSLCRYRRRLEQLGGSEADVPPRHETGRVVRDVLRRGALLVLVLPVAALGAAAWCLPYLFSGLAPQLLKPPSETVATVKLLAGLVSFPVTYVGWIALAAWLGGPLPAILAALVLPLLGLAALSWAYRRVEVWEDMKLLFQIFRRPKLRDRAAVHRQALAAELDAIEAEWQAKGAGRTAAQGAAS
jgi:1-acyl-sn-glycerol-3-phosphate acyltransferase